ncbi:MAG: hypothetical protein SGBAC_011481 [Bacillariaceae sp.]
MATTTTSTTTTTTTTTTALKASAADLADGTSDLYLRTPLIYSQPISTLVGKPVYCKMDALQASGSFKDRGMAHLCATFAKKGVTKVISSSGGNAGLAVTTVGAKLGMDVAVIVPQTTKAVVVAKLESLGADVTIHGKNWNEADTLARELVAKTPGTKYVSPYDDPLLWTGHSTLIDEIVQDLPAPPGAVVVSVIASETKGASSFGQAWEAGKVVTLPGIDTIATSLGATSVTPVVLERAKAHSGTFHSSICSDGEAVDACLRFSQDHRLLVEPANGAALAVAYTERLRDEYLKDVEGPIVLEVCGGSGVNLDLLMGWKKDYSL